MRYLIDTNIFIYLATDMQSLNNDIKSILQECDTRLYMSCESVKELIVAFRNKGIGNKYWNSAEDIISYIKDEANITILPVTMDVMEQYASLELNERENHKDPSDHVIISHALKLKLPIISSDRKFDFYRKQGLDLLSNY